MRLVSEDTCGGGGGVCALRAVSSFAQLRAMLTSREVGMAGCPARGLLPTCHVLFIRVAEAGKTLRKQRRLFFAWGRWKILQKRYFWQTQVYRGLKRQKHSKGLGACGSGGTVKRRNCCRVLRLNSDFTSAALETFLMPEETPGFSASHEVPEGTDVRSESKDSLWIKRNGQEMTCLWAVFYLDSALPGCLQVKKRINKRSSML